MGDKKVYNTFFDKETWAKANEENKVLLEDFILELKQRKRSKGTQYQYRNDLKGLLCYIYKELDNASILLLTKKDFRKYSLYLSEECGLSSARHNRLLSSLRSLLAFAEEDDDNDYDNNAARLVRGLPNESVREIVFLSDDEILRLKEELIKRKEYQKATLLMLAYDSAARKAELWQVNKMSFIDESKSNTNKVIGKGRKVFPLIYFSGTKECAKLWLEQRGEDSIDSLWVLGEGGNKRSVGKDNLYDWFIFMRELLKEIQGGNADFNVHSLRHSCLQNLSNGSHYICKELGLKDGFPVEKLRLIAQHQDISTTQAYLKDTGIEELENMFGIKIED